MSNRRYSRSREARAPRITDGQIADLVSKLRHLIPQNRRSNTEVSNVRVLEETCNYIRSLRKEVDDLSSRLSQLLDSTDGISSTEAAFIRTLLIANVLGFGKAVDPSPLH